ncbi:hypothetical protein GCM10010315_11130 [Streptomyces luteosporeus]|uniref:Uncharacterized protein n=1 Tax=Streptomyces luteosporeus TaxID=173856 RepID=A0ABP6G0Z8_9ACTN
MVGGWEDVPHIKQGNVHDNLAGALECQETQAPPSPLTHTRPFAAAFPGGRATKALAFPSDGQAALHARRAGPASGPVRAPDGPADPSSHIPVTTGRTPPQPPKRTAEFRPIW